MNETNRIKTEKIEYITNQLSKTFGKKYENYCVTRIYSLLKRDDIKIVTQQLFKRKGRKIALADLYLPQINMWIEIDEGHHINNKNVDLNRTKDVKKVNTLSQEAQKKYSALDEVVPIGIEDPFRVDVYNKSLEDINKQIDVIVNEINDRIKKQGKNFIPWTKVNYSPEEFVRKGKITVNDNAKFKTIDQIGMLFNMKKVPMGKKIHGYVNIKNNMYIWCPIVKIQGDECDSNAWENEISDDGIFIYENQKERKDNFLTQAMDELPIRYIFIKFKDDSRTKVYKFIGVYELDVKKSINKNIRVWAKKGDEIDLKVFK